MEKFNHCEQAEIDIDRLKKEVTKLEQELTVERGPNERHSPARLRKELDALFEKNQMLKAQIGEECKLNDRLHVVIEDWKKMYEEERRGANRLENALHALLPLR